MDYGEEKESASCQQREMPIFGSKFGKIWQKGHFGGSATCKSTSHEERKERYVAFLRSSSPKAMRRPMSWQKKEHCWTQGLWRKQDRKLCSRRGRWCTQLCSTRPASTAWQKNGQTGRSPDMVQKVFGICEAKKGTETDERLQAGADGHPKRMAKC